MTPDQSLDFGDLVGVFQRLQIDHLQVAAAGKVAGLVQHVGDAARHAGREVAPRRAQHDDAAAGHVFAAVVAHALDHRVHAAVAHAEALAGHAADVGLAAGGAIEGHVADDDVFFGTKVEPSGG